MLHVFVILEGYNVIHLLKRVRMNMLSNEDNERVNMDDVVMLFEYLVMTDKQSSSSLEQQLMDDFGDIDSRLMNTALRFYQHLDAQPQAFL